MMVSGGYPGPYEKGKPISGIDRAEERGSVVFHSATKQKNDELVTNGGRVLAVTAVGATPGAARASAYTAVSDILFSGAQYRRDIGEYAG